MRYINDYLMVLGLLVTGCAEQLASNISSSSLPVFTPVPFNSPVPDSAVEQRLAVSPDGRLITAWWWKHDNDETTLMTSILDEDEYWSKPERIATMPKIKDVHLVSVGDAGTAAVWLTSAPSKYIEGEIQEVYVSWGDRVGSHWSAPQKLAQPGLVSNKESLALTALDDGDLLAAWVDMGGVAVAPDDKPTSTLVQQPALKVARITKNGSAAQFMDADRQFCTCCAPALVSGAKTACLPTGICKAITSAIRRLPASARPIFLFQPSSTMIAGGSTAVLPVDRLFPGSASR